MSEVEQEKNMVSDEVGKSFPNAPLFLAFFFSGMSGLIYQTVWVRMLTRYLGSTTAATSVILCVFMGGLALGAYLAGRFADRMKRKLMGYVILEICIAVTAIVSSFMIISMLGGVYVNFIGLLGDNLFYLMFARIVFCMICLLPPTLLMGATLPLLVAFVSQSHAFQRGLGHLYSINTFGALLGVFLTGFVLLGELGESASLYIAALFNLIAALLVYRLEKTTKSLPDLRTSGEMEQKPLIPPAYPVPLRYLSRAAIFVSGFTALAYEILWSRLLVLPLKTSVYSFSIMLGLFLTGIAMGSWLSGRFRISETSSAALFAFFEILIGFSTIAGLFVFTWLGKMSEGFITSAAMSLSTSFLMVFPIAVIFGWQFPVAVRCCVSESGDPGKETGWAYSANTVGAILGSIIAGFVLIPLAGTIRSFVFLAVVNVMIGCALLYMAPKHERLRLPAISLFLVIAFGYMIFRIGSPYEEVIRARIERFLGEDAQIYAFYEGIAGNTVPAGSPRNNRLRQLLINGVGMTRLGTITKLMAHLPMTLVEHPNKILIVCFGMGTTVRSAARFPSDKTIEINAVDIVPNVFDCFGYFHSDAKEIVAMPNVRLHADDGRNFLLVRKDIYDVITIDPAPPIHSAGTVNLYTREFLEICKSRLSPNGVVCLWLPPEPMSELMMLMKTFVNVFPGASLWGALEYPGFYLIGGHRSFEQTEENQRALVRRLSKIEDLVEWNPSYGDENILANLYLLGPKDFEKLVENIPEVSDDHPYTEFPLWRQYPTKEPNLTAKMIREYKKRNGMK